MKLIVIHYVSGLLERTNNPPGNPVDDRVKALPPISSLEKISWSLQVISNEELRPTWHVTSASGASARISPWSLRAFGA